MPTPKLDPVADHVEPARPSPKPSSNVTAETASGQTSLEPARPSTAETASGQTSLEPARPSKRRDTDAASTQSRRSWFKKKAKDPSRKEDTGSDKAVTIASSSSTERSRRSDEDDIVSPLEMTARDDEWRLTDDIRMQLDL